MNQQENVLISLDDPMGATQDIPSSPVFEMPSEVPELQQTGSFEPTYGSQAPLTREFRLSQHIMATLNDRYENIDYILNSDNRDVHRTYTHFEWLCEVLRQQYPGVVVPSIPEKSVQAKLKVKQVVTQSIRDDRYYGLIEFLRKVTEHPLLSHSEYVSYFFELPQQTLNDKFLSKLDSIKQYVSNVGSYITSAGGSVGSMAVKSLSAFSSILGLRGQVAAGGGNKSNQIAIKGEYEVRNGFMIQSTMLQNEKVKLKEISQSLKTIVLSKLEQSNQLTITDQQLTEWAESDLGRPEDTSLLGCINSQQIQQHKYYYKILEEIIYPLEYLGKDLEYALQLLAQRNQLSDTIATLAEQYNRSTENSQAIRAQYDRLTAEMNTMTGGLSVDLPWFCHKLNQEAGRLLQDYYSLQQEMNAQISQKWREVE